MGSVKKVDASVVADAQRTRNRNLLKYSAQEHMDAVVREQDYDSMSNLCTYATSTIAKFAAEGQAGVEWRDAVWAKCFQVIDEAETGIREFPSKEELIAELPEVVWPNTK